MEKKGISKVTARRDQIIDILNRHSIITLKELAEELGVTTETIRNDLKSEELSYKVVQAYGSVALAHTTTPRDIPYSFRKELNSESRRKIAAAACQLIAPGQVVVIEHNTIAEVLARTIAENKELVSSIILVTNSFSIMQFLHEEQVDIQLIFLGGNYSARQENTFGSTTVEQMEALRGDIAFLSPGAIDEALEITAYEEKDALLQKAIIGRCKKNVLLLEKNKYPEVALRRVNSVKEYDLIIAETTFEPEQLALLAKANTQVITI